VCIRAAPTLLTETCWPAVRQLRVSDDFWTLSTDDHAPRSLGLYIPLVRTSLLQSQYLGDFFDCHPVLGPAWREALGEGGRNNRYFVRPTA
jgi:hypothetical protein